MDKIYILLTELSREAGKMKTVGLSFVLLFLVSFTGIAQNPALPQEWKLFIADPEPKVFNGRVYVYGSKDDGVEKGWCSDRYHVISSSDLVNWKDHGESFRLTDVPSVYMDSSYRRLWAPDLIKHPSNGKYYMFFCFNHTRPRREKIMVAEADKPEGPFTNARPVTIDGQPIVAIDPGVMVDDDGKAYITWPFKMAQLDPHDYGKIISNTLVNVEQWMPLDNTPFEGPSLRKRGDTYYYIYIQNNGMRYLPDSTTFVQPSKMAYLTSKGPLGPYQYGGLIIENTNYPNAVNIHGSLVEFNKQWYVFYHLPVADKRVTRRTSIEPIQFDSAGRIKPVLISSSGAKGSFLAGDTIYAAGAIAFSNWKDVHYKTSGDGKANLEFTADSAFAGFRYVTFRKGKPGILNVSVSSQAAGAQLELRVDKPDGPLLGSISIPNTNGKLQQLRTAINVKAEEKRTVFVVVKSQSGKPVFFEWMMFL